MKYIEQERRRGPQGAALVLTVNNALRIQFLDEWGQANGHTYQFTTDAVPYSVPDGNYQVSISAEGDRLYGIRPLNGTVVARFVKIAAKEGALPVPKRVQGTRTKKDGTTYPVDELTFNVIAKIDVGQFKGMELVFPFLYARKGSGFVDDGNGMLAYRGGGNKGEQLVQFLEAAGVWKKTLPFSDNVLPMLEAELKAADKPFMVVLRNGWPSSFGDVPDLGLSSNGHNPGVSEAVEVRPPNLTTEEAVAYLEEEAEPEAVVPLEPVPTRTKPVAKKSSKASSKTTKHKKPVVARKTSKKR